MAKLWQFNGSLRLAGNKDCSQTASMLPAAIPEQLIYPLQQRVGVVAEALVAVAEHVLKGQLIANTNSALGVPIHAASSGVVKAIEQRLFAHPSGLTCLCIVIDTDGLDQALAFKGELDYQLLGAKTIQAKIQQAGIVGFGSAAFPTAIKIKSGTNSRIDTLIINATEYEPYISCNDRLIQDRPEDIITGALILLHALQIDHCIIAIENDTPDALLALEQVLKQGSHPQIEIKVLRTLYPISGDKQLIKVVTGKAVSSDGFPANIGVLCQNVGTVTAVYDAIIHGLPMIERVVTITGNGVHKQQNLLVKIGTPIKELIAQCGGYTELAERLIMAGSMMGFALPDDTIAIVKASNRILVTDAKQAGHQQAMPCIRCGECANVCPMTLLPQQLYWYSRADNLEQAEVHRLFDCIECGCCEIVCPSHIPLVQYYRASKSKIFAKDKDAELALKAKRRYEQQILRKQREKVEQEQRTQNRRALLAKSKAAKQTRGQQ